MLLWFTFLETAPSITLSLVFSHLLVNQLLHCIDGRVGHSLAGPWTTIHTYPISLRIQCHCRLQLSQSATTDISQPLSMPPWILGKPLIVIIDQNNKGQQTLLKMIIGFLGSTTEGSSWWSLHSAFVCSSESYACTVCVCLC